MPNKLLIRLQEGSDEGQSQRAMGRRPLVHSLTRTLPARNVKETRRQPQKVFDCEMFLSLLILYCFAL
jgi:hypothetical protein